MTPTCPVNLGAFSPACSRDYLTLLKPGVMGLVVFTGLVGMLMAPMGLHPVLGLTTVLCIALGSGGAAAINMWYDADIDSQMRRTQQRPIPQGRVQPEDALALGLGLSALSVLLLGLAVSVEAAALLAFSIVFYAVIYTMGLKRSTAQNIVIGGAAGAFPPVIGWLAAGGSLMAPLPWILFAITFLWTPPHFWALCLYRCEDYRVANIPMLPVVAGVKSTKIQMLVYTLLLAGVCLLPWAIGQAGLLYGVAAVVLNGAFVAHAVRVLRSEEPRHAMAMFGFSILYLFVLYGAFLADRIFLG